MADIASLLERTEFHMLSVVRSSRPEGGWQANLRRKEGDNTYLVLHGATPAEALCEVLQAVVGPEPAPLPSLPTVPLIIPPPPY